MIRNNFALRSSTCLESINVCKDSLLKELLDLQELLRLVMLFASSSFRTKTSIDDEPVEMCWTCDCHRASHRETMSVPLEWLLYSSKAFGEFIKSGKGSVTPHEMSRLVKYLFILSLVKKSNQRRLIKKLNTSQ